VLRHPEPDVLSSLVEALDTGTAGLLLHVLRCEDCASRTLASLAPVHQRMGSLVLRREAPETDYSRLWERIEANAEKAMAQWRRDRSAAEPLLAQLLELPPRERMKAVTRQPQYRSRAMAELLLDEIRLRPGERADLAWLALAILGNSPPHDLDRAAAEDLALAAHCELGESFRSVGNFEEAEVAFEEAAKCLQGVTGVQERATYCHLLAALRRDEERTDEALALLVRAADLLGEAGNRTARAAVLVELGCVALEIGESLRALAAFTEATACGRYLSAGPAFRAAQGVALALAFEGRLEEALASLAGARELYGWTADSKEGLRLLALEGRLALSSRDGQMARALLTTVFNGLARLGEPFDACCAAVHLARSLVQDRRPRRELRKLVPQLQPLLASPKIPEEAQGLLSRFVADVTGTAPLTPNRLRDLADELERMRESAGRIAET
jgi:tetratricopeptide (TPR) repeat protein